MSPELSIPVPGEGVEEMSMSDQAASLHEQNLAQLAQIGVLAQANFVTVGKAQDYGFQQEKNMVSLTEALGAREIGSRVSPGGPTPATP